MREDITHKDKVYRIFSEGPTREHPCESISVVFDVSNPTAAVEVARFNGYDHNELATLTQNARVYVKGI